MLILGIILGLGSALCSSLAYLASRRFTVRHAGHEQKQPGWRGPLRLMVCSHVMLAVVCGIAFLILAPKAASDRPADLGWAITTTVFVALFYLAGNTLVFFALRISDASRIAPILGFKLMLLALMTHFALGDPLNNQEWLSVMLGTVAAVLLGVTGGRLPWASIILTLGSCMGFVCSDIFISKMVPAWLPANADYAVVKEEDGVALVKASMTGMALVYVWCGVIAAALLPVAKPWRREHWRGSAPYAASWITAMVCLFSTFALTNLILGNILQSTRGLMSIALGVLVVKLGHHHIETHAPLKVVIQRAIAAAMMVGAITLYVTA